VCAGLAAVGLLVSGCGGSGAAGADKPSRTLSTSATPTPTPTPAATPTPTETPLSPFEDEAPVKAARAFFVLVAQRLNARDFTLAGTAPLATPAGVKNIAGVYHVEIAHRAVLPGPQPFTPVNVSVKRREAQLSVCMKNEGWARDPRTKRPWAKPSVGPVLMVFKRVGGSWKFDHGSQGTADCAGVRIPEVKF
jgi:hypothetical protein